MDENKISYNRLSAEFYDLDLTYPPEKEVAFLSSFIEQGVQGPWLEAMSGSGRILIPLLQKGYVVEGVDNSKSMLARCIERMKQLNLKTEIYDQSVVRLALPKKYSGIIICFASFQLLDRADAIETLRRLKEHLLPGGMILIDLFVPWESIKKCIVKGDLISQLTIDDAPALRVQTQEGDYIERSARIDMRARDQYIVSHATYTKYNAQGIMQHAEHEEITLNWYYRYEMVLLLEQGGFKQVNIIDQNEEMVTYQAF